MPEIDRMTHQPTRLRILMLLSGLEEADFNFLLNSLDLTKGNLSRQTAKLEEADYIEIEKGFNGKIPKTTYRLTPTGRKKLQEYWEKMDELREMGEDL